MFTSFLAKDGHQSTMAGQQSIYGYRENQVPDILGIHANDNVVLKPILDYGQKLMND